MRRATRIASIVLAAALASAPAAAQHTNAQSLVVEHPSLTESRYPSLLDTAAVQAALRPEDIVVTFLLAEPNSFRWVMSQEHVVRDLIAGRSALEKDVARLRELLRAPTAGDEVKAVSSRLGAMLFDQISTADDRPLIVVPHGALHYIPFEVLQLQGRMLIERHPISYAPSLNALVQLRRAPFRVLAVGNPAISGSAAAAGRANVENLSLPGPLPFADRELHAIPFAPAILRRFYREITDGHSPEEALRHAKLAYANHPQYSHPYYWSSVVMVGDGTQPLVAGVMHAPRGQTILAAAFALAALGIVVVTVRAPGRG